MSWKPLGTPDRTAEEMNEILIRELALSVFLEEGHTLLHCRYRSKEKFENGGWMNIGAETFLQHPETREKMQMTHALYVPLAPQKHWFRKPGEFKNFTLIFPRIPDHWFCFSLVEYAKAGDGFLLRNIQRNDSGVYHIELY